MSSRRCSTVHPINVFNIPLSGPGFQVIMKQPRSNMKLTEADECDEITNSKGFMVNYPALEKSIERKLIPSDCPKGLEVLVNTDYLFIKQSQLVTDLFLNVTNKFEVLNNTGDFVFLAADTTPPLTRIFCFGGHPFELSLHSLPGSKVYSWNSKGNEILRLTGTSGSCGCGGEVSISIAQGTKTFGSIEQEGDCTRPVYSIKNSSDKEVYRLRGPKKSNCFACGFSETVTLISFDICLPDNKTVVGRIARKWESTKIVSGENPNSTLKNLDLPKSESTDKNPKDGFWLWGIRFPKDTSDVGIKAMLLSSVFLLEFQYYSN